MRCVEDPIETVALRGTTLPVQGQTVDDLDMASGIPNLGDEVVADGVVPSGFVLAEFK
ncbi:hypothetical protein [Brevundimonas sp. LM2]|uniref:hypothetical protein n=1 Tax=Brevundimonas sp. LM2 TaxID=1938605 RepID=UPI0015C532CE|nr:hypothetical protein [Brevundimonas sp. LM2]